MTVQQCTRAEERVETAGTGELDCTPLLGTWLNTNPEARGIPRIVVRSAGPGALAVHAYGAGPESLVSWGEVPAQAFAKSADSAEAMAFKAFYEFPFLRIHLQANIKQGVLVMASFNEFTDGSGRASYFTREFYYR